MAKRPTDQANYILDAQRIITKISVVYPIQENHVSLMTL